MLDLSGKVAVVTGAGNGIGEGISLVLARAGADVLSSDISAERAERTAEQLRGIGRRSVSSQVDVRDRDALAAVAETAVAEFGSLDICVANAGISRRSRLLTMTEEEWDDQINVNQKGVFLTVQTCARQMVRRNRGGRVITISSIAARRAPVDRFAYAASKAAVHVMTRSWAQELAPFGITVNSIGPGIIETPLSRLDSTTDGFSELERGIPAGRVGQPADIGKLACWLASDEAAYVTGTYNVVDCGITDMAGYLMHGDYDRSVRDLAANRQLSETGSGAEILAVLDERAASDRDRDVEWRAETGLK